MKWLRALLAGIIIACAAPSGALTTAQKEILLASHGLSCATAQTFLARASGLDNLHLNGYTDLICGMVDRGLWAKADAIYVLATQNTATALLNLKSTSFSLTEVSSPTFTIDRGYAGNGTTSYLTTGFNPSTAGGVFTQNSASLGVWTLGPGTASAADAGAGVVTSGGTYVNSDGGGAQVAASTNISTASSVLAPNIPSGPKFALGNRSGASAEELYVNGVVATTSANASQAPINFQFFIGASNQSGTPGFMSTKPIGFVWIGQSLTAADAFNLYALVRRYLSRIGAYN